jgi:hypothetical protein
MGLVVVARLSARHGVKVELRPAPERGTVADVLLPGGVLVPRALAGRSQAPAGFPAARQPAMPPSRPAFAPPLALESAPSGAPAWSGDDRFATPPPVGASAFGFGGPPAGGPPPTAFPPSGGPPSGLGAALAGSYGPNGSPGAPANGAGRPLPAWYDLTGATDGPEFGAAAPPDAAPATDPLPQRRPAGQWGDPEPDPATFGPATPRQGMQAPQGLSQDGSGADFTAPAASASTLPPMPSGFAGGPPAASRPPVWPPVSPPGGEAGADGVPALPEQLSASLDMTSELPRMRDGQPADDAAAAYPGGVAATTDPARYADDLTMELPIFQELESAWFRTPDSASSGATAGSYDSWTQDGGAAMAGSARAEGSPRRSAGGSDGAAGAADTVSWRSNADAGWSAARAAGEPQDGGMTETGLPRRVPMAQLVPGGVEGATAASERRTPDAVRGLLSAYHQGVQKGRNAQGKSEASASASAGPRADQQTSGKEQEA